MLNAESDQMIRGTELAAISSYDCVVFRMTISNASPVFQGPLQVCLFQS